MRRSRLLTVAVLGSAIAFALAACGGNGTSEADAGTEADTAGATPESLTVYSGRDEELVGPLFEQFEQDTGIAVEVRYGDSAELAATIAEEGTSSPADVFLSQDAGALGAVAAEELLAVLPPEGTELVEERFRDPQGRWIGLSGRARVLAYNTELVDDSELPQSITELTDPKWKGQIGLPPTNASFQAFVTAMRLTSGDDATRDWLEALKANEPSFYESNSQTVEAVASGEIALGLVNHYYLYGLLEEQPDAPVANHYLGAGDPGALVNVAGVGILASTDASETAERLVAYLLDPAEGQAFFAGETAEYPLVAGVKPSEQLPPLADVHGPELALGDLGPELESTLQMLNEVGFTS